jgi:hypothetical protein
MGPMVRWVHGWPTLTDNWIIVYGPNFLKPKSWSSILMLTDDIDIQAAAMTKCSSSVDEEGLEKVLHKLLARTTKYSLQL